MQGLIFGILRYFSLFFAMLNLTAPLKKNATKCSFI